jgi:hypothetical protein
VDGRLVLLGLLGCYFLALALLANWRGAEQAWADLGVPSADLSFFDLRSVTTAWECTRRGIDILPVNPCDPVGRPANYPRLWMAPAGLGLGEGSTVYLGVATAFVFFAAALLMVGHVGSWEALIYAAALCSPAVMLGVERGNADLLVFALVAFALASFRRGALGRALAHGVLVLAFGVLLRQRREWALAGAGTAVLLFLVYAVATAGDLRSIARAVPQEVKYSYGIGVGIDAARDAVRHTPSAPGVARSRYAGLAVHALVGLAGLGLAAWLALRRGCRRAAPPGEEEPAPVSRDLDAFWAGAGIFGATFALFNNYDYRLVFLLLTLPQLLRWAREPRPVMPFAWWAVAGVLASLWLGTSLPVLPLGLGELWTAASDVFPFEEILNWLLFVYFGAALLLTRPSWLARRATVTNDAAGDLRP